MPTVTSALAARIAETQAVLWYSSPARHLVTPNLQEQADRSAYGEHECLQMLQAASDVIDARCRRTPDANRLLMVVVDDAHKLFTNEAITRAADDVARRGRKTGVVLAVITCSPRLAEFGSSAVLRDNL